MEPLTDQQLQQFKLQLAELKQELFHLLAISTAASDVVALDQSRVGRLSRMDALQ